MTAARSARPAVRPGRALPQETESEFQLWVIEVAKLHGWHVVHFRPARVGRGPRTRIVTPMQGHRGAPDLILARAGVVLLAELKTDTGRVAPEQRAWLDAIGPEIGRLWRPSDRDAILVELSQRAS